MYRIWLATAMALAIACTGELGLQGVQGPPGPQSDPGPQGEQGPPGDVAALNWADVFEDGSLYDAVYLAGVKS